MFLFEIVVIFSMWINKNLNTKLNQVDMLTQVLYGINNIKFVYYF